MHETMALDEFGCLEMLRSALSICLPTIHASCWQKPILNADVPRNLDAYMPLNSTGGISSHSSGGNGHSPAKWMGPLATTSHSTRPLTSVGLRGVSPVDKTGQSIILSSSKPLKKRPNDHVEVGTANTALYMSLAACLCSSCAAPPQY